MGRLGTRGSPEFKSIVLRASEITPTSIRFLWPGRVPLGKLTILEGDPGLGKSTLLLDLAARVSTGHEMPDGTPGVEGGVLILTAEDGAADTVVPRLTAAGADLSRIWLLTDILLPGGGARLLVLPDDIEALRQNIEDHRVVLVIVDPFVAYLASYVNSWKDQDVRQALYPLARLAEDTGAAVIALRHLNKRLGGPAVYRGGGSIGILGAARSALLVAKDPDNPERRVLAVVKSNLAARAPSLTYRIEAAAGEAARIVWGGESRHGSDALVAEEDSSSTPSAVEYAAEFLVLVLVAGPQREQEVEQAARARGIASKTLTRARKALGVESRRVGGIGKKGYWVLELPKGANSDIEEDGPLSSAVAGPAGGDMGTSGEEGGNA